MAAMSLQSTQMRSAGARGRANLPAGPWVYDQWVTKPAQNRSEHTFYRLLDAAEGLLTARHWHEVSVQEIASNARASVGSFYNRFSDKTALLRCLDDRLGQECSQTIDELIASFKDYPALRDDAPGVLVSLFMRLCSDRGGVIRALDLESRMAADQAFSGLGPKFDAAMQSLSEHLCGQSGALEGKPVDAVTQAFRETFWLAREILLYRSEKPSAPALHKSLLRHFHASLEGWS